MNRYIAASAALIAGLFSISHANAQLAVAKVVATCGTVSPTPHAGSTYPLTIDITGTLCSVGGGGGGGGGTSSNFGAAFPGAGTAAGFEYLTSAPTLTNGQMVAGQTDVNGNLKVNVVSGGSANASVGATGSAVPTSGTYAAINVGGTLTGWPGTSTGGNVNPGTATLWGILTQGSTTSGQSGELMMGAVTTGAPTYTTAQTSPISLDTAGNIRVNVAAGGATGAADNSTFTYGTTQMTTSGCIFNSSITVLTSGHAGGVSCSTNREQYMDVLASSTLATDINAGTGTPGSATPSQGVAIGGTDGTNFHIMGVSAAGVVPVAPSPYPATAVPITASATGTTAATTATLTNVSGHTTYICGYSVRANATAATTVLDTVTGVITATMSSELWVAPAASGLGVDEQIFTPCIPASGASVSIAVVSGTPGAGGLVSVKAWGYSL